MASGDIDYTSGIGPASISATLSGLDSRALWSSSNRIAYWLMARPEFKSVQDLKNKKIGVSGLGGTSHVSMTLALEKRGLVPLHDADAQAATAQATGLKPLDAASLK